MRLLLARHGQSFINLEPDKYDNTAPLTPLGEKQAHNLGVWLKAKHPEIDTVYASPLKRAHQTAEIVNSYLKLPMIVDARLSEIERFDLPLLPLRDHPLRPETARRDPNGDGYYDTYREQVRGILDVLTADLERPNPILVVSHGGTSATLLRLILERHDIAFSTFNTGVHVIEWLKGRWEFHGLNLTHHLSADMLS